MITDAEKIPHNRNFPVNQESGHWEFYKDRFNQWQWRKFEGKKVVAVSADGFFSRQACVNNARTRGYIGA